jgi:hypothetical protein
MHDELSPKFKKNKSQMEADIERADAHADLKERDTIIAKDHVKLRSNSPLEFIK